MEYAPSFQALHLILAQMEGSIPHLWALIVGQPGEVGGHCGGWSSGIVKTQSDHTNTEAVQSGQYKTISWPDFVNARTGPFLRQS